jgi:hypothetical protein
MNSRKEQKFLFWNENNNAKALQKQKKSSQTKENICFFHYDFWSLDTYYVQTQSYKLMQKGKSTLKEHNNL